MGNAHINGFKKHPSCEVVAIADPDEARLKLRGDEHSVKGRYKSLTDMLKDEKLDVVSIATPNKFHKPLTLEALAAGCHVLCEKPMAMNGGEAREMRDAAKKAKRRLMINFSYRFSEQSWALKKTVETGILGEIYFARTVWHRRRGMPGFGGWFGRKELAGGGPLIDLGVHRLDLALWLMEYPKPTWVMGSAYDHIAKERAKREGKAFDVEDLAAGMVKFENGATLEIEASWAANIKERELMSTRLLGTKAGLLQRNVEEGYKWDAEIFLEREGCQYDMKLHPPVPEANSSMYHFVDCIVDEKPHIATPEEGIIVMDILDALYKSSETGRPVQMS
jgi:predicted dehydrogenase